MNYSEILHRCFRCGYCKMPSDYTDITCPSYLNNRFETFSPGGRLWLLRAWLDGEIQTSDRFSEIMFSCATCGNCVEHCVMPKFKDDLLNAMIAGREALVEEGAVPPAVRDYFKAVHVNGNPYKLPRKERGDWARGLGLSPMNGREYLFYVGDVGSFDERARGMTHAVATLLGKAGVSFGILGEDEKSDGNDVKALGETGLFQYMAEMNVEAFNSLGIKKIITLSPHGFNAFKNHYPDFGGVYDVYHYSQVLSRKIGALPLQNKKDAPLRRVVYHDPCYLGRHNNEYQAPRKVLKALPNVQFMELERSRSNALCCGGGGGNFFTDVIGTGPDAPSRNRVREAAETGADIIAVACPACLKMLEDAVKAESLEDRLRVMDLAEIVLQYC